MQPGTNPDDIHTILSRFNHWAGKQTANGNNGHSKALRCLDAGVREIPYEEAIRRMRSRKNDSAASVVAAQPAIDAAQNAVPSEKPPKTVGVPFPLRATPASPVPEPTALAAIPAQDPTRASRRTSALQENNARAKAKPGVTLKTRKALRSSKPAPKKRTAAQSQELPVTPEKQRRTSRTPSHAAPSQQPQFRQVLAKSIGEAKLTHKPVRAKEKGRNQRVSVRLSRTEERTLQACAAKAGVTVSEYLRMRALEALQSETVPQTAAPASAPHRKTAVAAPEAAKPPRSGLGDWIALLRNRFLASPTRFAERA
jgi:hypothetical protein